eukprot:12030069-Karenia_brevis.AAC.1
MPATQPKGPSTPRIPKVHVASFGFENYWKAWSKMEDFSQITKYTLTDRMESLSVRKDASR